MTSRSISGLREIAVIHVSVAKVCDVDVVDSGSWTGYTTRRVDDLAEPSLDVFGL